MKLKGISTLEHHAEKLVFLLFFAFFLFVLVLQLGLLGGGSATVKVGSRDVPLDEASKAVAEQAQQKLADMSSGAVNEEIPASLPNVQSMFVGAMSSNVHLQERLVYNEPQYHVSGSEGPVAPNDGDAPMGADIQFAAVVPPAPAAPLTKIHGCTLDPLVIAAHPELARFVPAQQPYDLRAVSIESKFEAKQFRQELTANGVPAQFWRGRVEILDVIWVRQTLASDGQWAEEEELTELPGRFMMRDRIEADDIDITDLQGILDSELDSRATIRRPAFYGYVSGDPWQWPSFGVNEERDPGLQAQIDNLLRRLRGIRNEISRLERLLGQQSWLPPRDQWPTPGEGWKWPTYPRSWRAQFGGGGGGGSAPPPPTRDREGDAKTALEARLADERAKETGVIQELTALGVNDQGQNLDEVGQDQFNEPLDSLSQDALDRITLWYHDLSARPDSTYRYQARVRITNPFYGKENELPAEQRDLAEALFVESPASDWSGPVIMQPDVVYFVRTAQAVDPNAAIANSARAGLELFEFYYGYWRKADINAYAGDTLMGEARLPEDLKTWTIDQGGDVPIAGEEADLDATHLIATSAVLLDVAPPLDAQADLAQVFLGSADGSSIIVRLAGADASGVWDRLASSADAGLRAQLRLPGTAIPVGQGAPAPDQPDPADPFGPPPGGQPAGGDNPPGGLPERPSDF